MENFLSSYINLPSWDGHNLEVEKISNLYKSTTTSYKFWWGLCLFDAIEQGRTCISVNKLILAMLCKSYPPYKTFHFSFGLQDMIPTRIDELEHILESHLRAVTKELKLNAELDGMPCKIEYFFKYENLLEWLLPLMSISSKAHLAKLTDHYADLIVKAAPRGLSQSIIDKVSSHVPSKSPIPLTLEARALLDKLILALHDYCRGLKDLNKWVPDRFLAPWNGNDKARDLSNNAPYCIISNQDSLTDALAYIHSAASDAAATNAGYNESASDPSSPIILTSADADMGAMSSAASRAHKIMEHAKSLLPSKAMRPENLVVFNPLYLTYFKRNIMVLRAFSYHSLAQYMEKHNRLMPAIVSKLYAPEQERNSLKLQHEYFRAYLKEKGPLKCIYNDVHFSSTDSFALDHFLPWSFVHHDMVWNLTPLDDKANSSKSNNLPPLELIERLAKQHQELLRFHFERANPPRGASVAASSAAASAASATSSAALMKSGDNNLGSEFNKIVDHYLEISHGKSIFDLTTISETDFCDLIGNEIRPSYQVARNQGFLCWNTPIV